MISKIQKCLPKNDNYGRLANYIADASHEGEKSLMSWCAGCAEDDDYTFAIQEVKDTQAMNTRTSKEKTYHLIISFHPEDENILNPDTFKAIEERFAHALGYTEHQRHCGVHKNTGNLHMHIAYNMIHPEKFSRHEPYRDFIKRDQVCRELEIEFGLTIDNGRGQKSTDLEAGAAKLEAHTGHQSFESYAKNHKESIMRSLESAKTWEDVHKAFAGLGMEIKPHGNGLVIKDRNNSKSNYAMKASTLDRSLSKKKLESLLGNYKASSRRWPENISYKAAVPVHRAPERGELFNEYKQGINERKEKLAAIKDEYELAQELIKQKWLEKRQKVMRSDLKRSARNRLLKLIKTREKEDFLQAKKAMYSKKEEITAKIPYTTWVKFLQQRAVNGNEVALAVLRSRNIKTEPEKVKQNKTWIDSIESKEQALQKQKDILSLPKLSALHRKKLLSVTHMQEISPSVRCNIDKKGTLIFNFENGVIRDNGKSIFFSDELTEVAKMYATKKWGKSMSLGDGKIQQQARAKQRTQDIHR